MSTTDKLGNDPAPAAIRYLVLLSVITSLLMAISFLPRMSGASSAELGFFQSAIPAFVVLSILTMIEWFVLRRSRKMIGPYGIAFGIEFLKTVLLSIGATYYIQQVSGASSADFFLLQMISIAVIFLLALTKVARSRIDTLAQKDVSRHILNLLPTLLILAIFLGTYGTEITGFGVPRQRRNFPDYTDQRIDWSMFSTPSWDASYLLENLMDQFTAGMNFTTADTPLFYVQSDDNLDPQGTPVYWRLGTLETYEYFDKVPYSTNWDSTDSLKRRLTPTPQGSPYSQEIGPSDRDTQFTIRIPLDYNSSIADVTIHPYFDNYLPTTWNGGNGSFVDANSFIMNSDNLSIQPFSGSLLFPSTVETREVFPMATTNDLLGIEANIQGFGVTSTEEGTLEYTMDYLSPNYPNTIAFSMGGSDSDYETAIGSSAEWDAIKNLYLQLPNSSDALPTGQWYVHENGGLEPVPGSPTYGDWAPTVLERADNFTQTFSTQSAFLKAYGVMQEFGENGSFSHLNFSQSSWVREQAGISMDRPEEYEDYNEWFLRTGEGVSIHFASLYSTIMRMMGLPSRVVIGYIAGNSSIDYYPYRMISSRYLHAWSEVLLPIDPLISAERVEWVSFDPLLNYLSEQYGFSLPADALPPAEEARYAMIDPTYDIATNGLQQAIADNASSPNDWIIQRCVVANKALGAPTPAVTTLTYGTAVNISVRLLNVPSLASWFYSEGNNITFYIGTHGEKTDGVFAGSAITDEFGLATLDITIQVAYGNRDVEFYALVADFTLEQAAISWTYRLDF